MRVFPRPLLKFPMLLAAVLSCLSAPSAVDKTLTIYAPQGTYSVPFSDRDGNTYIDLQSVLEALGPVSGSIEGNHLKLRFNNTGNEAQFAEGEKDARVGRSRLSLTAPFYLQNRRPQVALRSLPDLVGRLLGVRVDYREASQRLLVGVTAVHFVAELKRGQPSALVLAFSAPVSPQISAEGGRLKMTFMRDPLAGGGQNWKFDDPLITSASYADSAAEIAVMGSEPLLASFSDGGRTITISAAPTIAAAESASLAASSSGTGIGAVAPPSVPPPASSSSVSSSTPAGQNSAASPQTPPPAANNVGNVAGIVGDAPGVPVPVPLAEQPTLARQHFLLLLDAGHGGDEQGATLSESTVEKDINLAIARRLRAELQSRGVAVSMLRDGDQTISLDRRAEIANAMHPGLYLALHAASLGRGLRIYTSALPKTPSASAASHSMFLPWGTAQAASLSASGNIAASLVDELSRNAFRIPVGLTPAPVRPLNNIGVAAVAIEVSPQRDDVASLSDPDYQQSVAVALATAIAALRPQLGGVESSR